MSGQRYLVTARKYRPQTFGELVAQEHVTGTLKNAIRLDRLAHAYLFSGPRGVGKTTAARILAKAINCTTPLDQRADEAEPCRQCDSCRSFEEGRSLNIIEIDAASNNKVEDMRELRDTVRIPPQGNRKKVYIIDEVHMLSNAAFNALLKTLEEPPPYVLFIFATTEPHKVLPTILSRCQRFDFRRIAVPEIVARLETICSEEQIGADEAALVLIARKGDGALRDALSVFDQAVSLCGTTVEYQELTRALGVVDVDLFFETTEHVQGGNSAGMLHLVERLVRSGYDLQEFLAGLAEHLRNLLVACTTGDTGLIEATEATRQRYAEAAQAFGEADLLRLLMVVGELEEAIKNSTQPRLKLETGLLKMVGLSRVVDLRQALEKLARLEAMARDGELPAQDVPPSEQARSGSARVTPPAPPAEARREDAVREPARRMEAASAESSAPQPRTPAIHHLNRPAARSTMPDPVEKAEDGRITADEDADEESGYTNEPAAEKPGTVREPDATPSRPSPALGLFGTPALSLAKPPRDVRPGPSKEPGAMFAGSGALATVPVVAPDQERVFQAICTSWPQFVQHIKSQQIRIGALLAQGNPASVEDDVLVVSVPDDFHKRQLEGAHEFLIRHFADTLDDAIAKFLFVVRRDPPPDAATAPTPTEVDPIEHMQRRRQEDPVVRAIFEQFGGEIVW